MSLIAKFIITKGRQKREMAAGRDPLADEEEEEFGGPKRKLVCAGILLFILFLIVSMVLALAVNPL